MSISPFFGLDMALRALQAQQTGIDVTSHNVANANTEGFSRQNVTIVTTEPFAPAGMNRPASAGQIGTGSVANDIQRARDGFLDFQWRTEAGGLANAANRSDALEQVEVILDEPQGVGLSALFNEYYRVWNELSNDPSASALPVRTTVVQQSLSLTTAINRISSQLANIRTGQNSEIQTDVTEVNDLTSQIFQLNGTIVQIELTGQAANDLRDRRDSILDRLSQLVQVTTTENTDGSIRVLMGSGQTLVDGVTAKTDLTTAANASNNGFVDVIYGSGSTPASLGPSGIAGRITARDTLVPKYQASLNTIATNLINATNTLHTAGFDVNGNAGQPFFTGTDAATISVNTAIQADPSLIAASNSAGASGNNEVALAITALRNSMSPPLPVGTPTSQTAYNSMVAGLGTDNRTARNEVGTQESLVDLLARRRQSLSGVSLDEEATNLLRYQRAYEAAARVLSTYDEILDKLINGTGTVGRYGARAAGGTGRRRRRARMRITHRMISDTTVRNMRNNLAKLESLHSSITTGKRLSRPSDDPAAVARTLTYTGDIAAGEVFLRTMDSSMSWMSATDSALDDAGNLLQRARELAVQGANGALTPDDMKRIGAEVDNLLKQMVVNGNASLRGQRLFAGQQIDGDPFQVSSTLPGYTYSGDAGQMRREYDVAAYLTINTPGQATFAPAFTALFNLRDHLNAGNAAAISTSDITAVDDALDTILSARAEVGAKMNRIEAAQGRQNLLQVNLEDLRSKSEDTDFTEAVSKFSIQETVYKASLEVGGKAIQPSLLDYLR